MLQPVTGMLGPPSATPTLCAPTSPSNVPSRIDAVCSRLGPTMRNPSPSPAGEISAPSRIAQRGGRPPPLPREGQPHVTAMEIANLNGLSVETRPSRGDRMIPQADSCAIHYDGNPRYPPWESPQLRQE
ncbi:hypothetical protein GCM10027445_02970 [Amycolatopsis endophytica]